MWFDIIKMPNPYGGQWKFLTREQYYEMNDENKRLYHSAMVGIHQTQLNSLRARHQPLEAAPETLQNELMDLQKLRNFHNNQVLRIKNNRAEPVFSIEEDKNPPTDRLQTTPMGNIQYGEWDMTEEEYNAVSREEKMNYHNRKYKTHQNNNHSRELQRMKHNPNYISPYNPEDAKSAKEWEMSVIPIPSKEEYENMSNVDKLKFHGRMHHRYRKSNEKDLVDFHNKMVYRLRSKSQLPTYYSLEEERNA
tara:strand:- start:3412 stop:4158 length:747 start_codon:yes stop_codon:yes gene_type:complete